MVPGVSIAGRLAVELAEASKKLEHAHKDQPPEGRVRSATRSSSSDEITYCRKQEPNKTQRRAEEHVPPARSTSLVCRHVPRAARQLRGAAIVQTARLQVLLEIGRAHV